MKKFNAAIVGFGAVAPVHQSAIEKSKHANLYAVCDNNPKKLQGLSENIKPYLDFKQLLADDNVHAVHICTPHYLHVPMAVEALRHGKHVVLEKPVAMNKSELYDLIKEYEKTERKVCVMFQNRTNNCIVKMADLAKNDKSLGKMLGITGFLTWHRTPEYYMQDSWRGKWKTEGGGLVINQAVHMLDLLNLLGGKIKSVTASMSNKSLQGVIEVEDTADALFEFENQMRGCLYCTNAYPPSSPFRIEINFENALLRYADNRLYKITDENVEIIAFDNTASPGKSYWGSGHAKAIDDFYTSLAEGNNNYITLEDSVHSTNVMIAMYESAKENKKIIL